MAAGLEQVRSEGRGTPRDGSPREVPVIGRDRIPGELRRLMDAFEAAGHRVWLTGPVARELVGSDRVEARSWAELVVDAPRPALVAVLAGAQVAHEAGETGRRLLTAAIPVEGRDGELRRIQVAPVRTAAPPWRWLRERKHTGITLDLAAREITVHAFAIEASGAVVDPFGGVADLLARRIRTVLPADRVFCDSAMALLRVARWTSAYDFAPSQELVRFAQRDAGNILDTPREQWKEHLDKILLGPGVIAAFQFLYDARVLAFLLPEVASLVGFHESCPVHHKDIWDHTLKVVAKAERSLIVRWTALMHDIGKIWTRQVTKGGKVHFFRHEELGALLFEGIAARLRFDPQTADRIAYVIRNHGRVNLYEDDWTDSAVRRLIRDFDVHLEDLIAFSKADFTTKRAWRASQLERQMAELEARIAAIREADARVPPLPTGLGNDMMTRFGLTPGPRIGELKRALEAAVEAGELAPHQESSVYLDWLAEKVADLG